MSKRFKRQSLNFERTENEQSNNIAELIFNPGCDSDVSATNLTVACMTTEISWERTPKYTPSNRQTGSKDEADGRDYNKKKKCPESYNTTSMCKAMKFSLEKTDKCNKQQASSFHW